MRLETRLEKIEKQCNIGHRCTLVVAVWNGTAGPTKQQSDQYLAQQKASGQCEKCSGVCVLDWTMEHPKIWRQQSPDALNVPVEDHQQGDVSFVTGKGYV